MKAFICGQWQRHAAVPHWVWTVEVKGDAWCDAAGNIRRFSSAEAASNAWDRHRDKLLTPPKAP